MNNRCSFFSEINEDVLRDIKSEKKEVKRIMKEVWGEEDDNYS